MSKRSLKERIETLESQNRLFVPWGKGYCSEQFSLLDLVCALIQHLGLKVECEPQKKPRLILKEKEKTDGSENK